MALKTTPPLYVLLHNLDNTLFKTVGATTYSKDIFTILNNYLSDKSYLRGYEPTIIDAQVLDALDGASLSIDDLDIHFPHVTRWWRHIAYLRQDPVYRHCFFGDGKNQGCPSYKPTSDRSPMDRWMLSRVAAAIEACNNGFETYEFPKATTACYNLWLYDLCDVYLEYLKPVLNDGTPSEKSAAKHTLYTVLDVGLRLLSPFMPFLTEELYQRLPRKSCWEPPSICVTYYPELEDHSWRDLGLEAEVELMQKVVHSIRSAKSENKLPTKTKLQAYVVSSDPSLIETLKKYTLCITTLAICSEVVYDTTPPPDSTVLTITEKLEVHVLLKGLIDPPVEKMEKLSVN